MKQSIIIKCLLSLISAGLSLYFVITMKNLNILPNIYLYILIGIIILLNIITIIFIFSKKKWMKISGIIIFVIMPVVLLILDVHGKPHKAFRLLPGVTEDSFSGFLVGDHKHGLLLIFWKNFYINWPVRFPCRGNTTPYG